MQLLDSVEIKKIEQKLAAAEISNDSLSVDLVDHICCMIEERLNLGFSLDKAEEEVFKEMGEVQLKSIDLETQRLTQNKFIMKKRTKIVGLVALSVMLAGFIFKMFHLLGAGVLWGSGILIGTFGFFLMVLLDRFSYEKNSSRKLFAIIGYIGSSGVLMGIGFALLNWPIAKYLAMGGGLLLIVYFIITSSSTLSNDTSQ